MTVTNQNPPQVNPKFKICATIDQSQKFNHNQFNVIMSNISKIQNTDR